MIHNVFQKTKKRPAGTLFKITAGLVSNHYIKIFITATFLYYASAPVAQPYCQPSLRERRHTVSTPVVPGNISTRQHRFTA